MLAAIKKLPTCTLTKVVLINYIAYLLKSKGYFKKKSLKGEHAFITGAGSGLGKTIAKIMALKGACVTIGDVNLKAAEDTYKEIKALGGNATYVFCDVSKQDSVLKAATHSTTALGPVTILVNNAGIVKGKEIDQLSSKDIELTMNINLSAHFNTIRAFLPHMLKENKGHIITISSNAGLVGVRKLTDYCASKFGVLGLDESLRIEMKHRGKNIKTTCICPYYINTGMFDGVKSKSWLLPILDMKKVAERIVLAIEQEEEMLALPFLTSLIPLLRATLPVKYFDNIMQEK